MAEKKASVKFEPPPADIPAPEPAVPLSWVPSWANTAPGDPDAPTMTKNGWSGGGKVKYTLCPSCTHYSEADDLCTSAAPESWRADAMTCIMFRDKRGA
jgi:hypothetical protein